MSPWIEAENKLPALEKLLKCEINRNEFRDFVDSYLESRNNIPPSIMCAKKIANTISISSAEAERGFSNFSIMNDIATTERSNLIAKHISDLMTIKIIGKSLSRWDATPFVKSWIRKKHRDATDTRIRKKVETKYIQKMICRYGQLFNIFKKFCKDEK